MERDHKDKLLKPDCLNKAIYNNFSNLYAVVLYDCNGDDQNELLSTEIGDLMVIHNLVIRDGLTFGYGYIKGEESKTGYVPKQYLNFIDGADGKMKIYINFNKFILIIIIIKKNYYIVFNLFINNLIFKKKKRILLIQHSLCCVKRRLMIQWMIYSVN